MGNKEYLWIEVYGQRVALPSAEEKGLYRAQEWKNLVVEKGARVKENEAKLETVVIRQNKALVETRDFSLSTEFALCSGLWPRTESNHDLPFLQLSAPSKRLSLEAHTELRSNNGTWPFLREMKPQ